jgi:hypothetical protein
VEGDAQLIGDHRARVAEGEEGGDRDGYRALVAQRFRAGGNGRARVDGVVDDAHLPAADAAGHRRQVISGRLAGRAVAGQEGGREQVGDGVGQERAAFQRSADRVDRVLPQPVRHPADGLAQAGRAVEQPVQVQPDVPVVPGTQVEVPPAGLGQPDRVPGLHPAIVSSARVPSSVCRSESTG